MIRCRGLSNYIQLPIFRLQRLKRGIWLCLGKGLCPAASPPIETIWNNWSITSGESVESMRMKAFGARLWSILLDKKTTSVTIDSVGSPVQFSVLGSREFHSFDVLLTTGALLLKLKRCSRSLEALSVTQQLLLFQPTFFSFNEPSCSISARRASFSSGTCQTLLLASFFHLSAFLQKNDKAEDLSHTAGHIQ